MLIKTIVDEDFSNYKRPSMLIGTVQCDFKCCTELNLPITICQNNPIYKEPNIDVSVENIYNRYTNNKLTSAIVLGGLEPMLQFDDMLELISYFRNHGCDDDFVIFTGYYKDEIQDKVLELSKYKNIVIKFGRYIPNQTKHFDEVLGVDLISNNQYAEKIS